ncbi:MAG TPA: LPS export ABC transporter periplasmic protein LptC [Firmicutes bacterium]|nr:LPS export ABC transporter periplasmic protein LptC [Bacillota bacterium]
MGNGIAFRIVARRIIASFAVLAIFWMTGGITGCVEGWSAGGRAGISAAGVVEAAEKAMAGKAKEKVQIRADKSGDYDLEKDVLILEGNVIITQGETVIRADRVEIDMNKKVAKVTTGVNLTQPDLVLTGKVFTAYLNDKRVIVEGDVVLQKDEEQASAKQGPEKPGDSGKMGAMAAGAAGTGTGGKGEAARGESARVESKGEVSSKKKDRITLRCDRLEYWTEKKESTATGNIAVTKGETRAWGDKAVYREKDKLFILSGRKVRVERGKGETMTCAELTMYTDRDVVVARNNVEIEFETD